MNHKAIKKYAEVAAFVTLAGDMHRRAGTELQDYAPRISERLRTIGGAELPQVAADDREAFETKLAKTTEKLTRMMDLYVGDEWDNPVEVLEWSSFYAGAAAAHCAVTDGLIDEDDATSQAIRQAVHQLEGLSDELLRLTIARLGGRPEPA